MLKPTPLLEVRDLHAWYGESHVLHGMSFSVRKGEVVTLLGRNGVGKTTTMRSIMGVVGKRSGSVRYGETETIMWPSNQIARLGIGYCPEERGIFASLNVTENLLLPPAVKGSGLPIDEIHALFPQLKERARSQGTKLSGGEQQMLAIARGLMAKPKLLLLDEPSLGLAPAVINDLFGVLDRLRAEDATILLVDQMAGLALTLADRAYVMESGRIVAAGAASEIAADGALERAYLGAT